jgi:hypothetical protein
MVRAGEQLRDAAVCVRMCVCVCVCDINIVCVCLDQWLVRCIAVAW